MEKRSNAKFVKASAYALLICCVAYVAMGLICMSMFGAKTESDVMLNFASKPGVVSITVRLIFSAMLLIHIPFLIFPTKEIALVLHDEVVNKSLSTHLEAKLQIAD